jgi:cation:H+ antiporter
VIGSNIFNVVGVLGITGLARDGGLPVAPGALRFDIPVMLAATFACIPIFSTGHRIDRWEGVLLLAYYALYVTYLALAAARHDALPTFSAAMMAFVIPLTVVTLLVVALHAAKRGSGEGAR